CRSERGGAPRGGIFPPAEKSIWRATLVAAIERTFALALFTRQNIVSDEDFVADGNSLGVRFPPARVEPWLGGSVHFVPSTAIYLGHEMKVVAGHFCPGQRLRRSHRLSAAPLACCHRSAISASARMTGLGVPTRRNSSARAAISRLMAATCLFLCAAARSRQSSGRGCSRVRSA